MSISLKEFRKTDWAQASHVVMTSIVPFFGILSLSYYLMQFSYWWVILLALPAHWFHSRMFIVMHDCGHNSFTQNKWLNNLLGHLCGLTFYTPFLMWRQLHNRHHLHQGNLDKRHQSLDVWVLTKQEFLAAPKWKKTFYRLYRNPLLFFILGPFLLFLGVFRVPFEKFSFKIVANIIILNLLLIAIYYLAQRNDFLIKLILVQVPTLSLSFVLAIWLFYIQHQFENTIWFRDYEYNFEAVGLFGSSYYNVSPLFKWWTGNISYHHVHHLDVNIPMYNLEQAHQKITNVIPMPGIGFRDTIKLVNLKLWDEDQRKMVPF